MTDNEKIALVKKLFGKKGDFSELTDAEITPFLLVAESAIINRAFPYAKANEALVMPSRYDILQCRIANFLLVKQGAEGEIQHTEGGVTCIYGQADIPDNLMNEVVPRVGVFG